MKRFLLSIVLQAMVVLFVFPFIDSGFQVTGGFENALIVVVSFIVLNIVVRKLITIFTLGIGKVVYFLTLGVAGLFINALVLVIIKYILPNMLLVPSFKDAFIGGFALAVANYFTSD